MAEEFACCLESIIRLFFVMCLSNCGPAMFHSLFIFISQSLLRFGSWVNLKCWLWIFSDFPLKFTVNLRHKQFQISCISWSRQQWCHSFYFWQLTALRHRLHGHGFQSKWFHDLEIASKTIRFQRVYTEPSQPFMSMRLRSQAFVLRQLDLNSTRPEFTG